MKQDSFVFPTWIPLLYACCREGTHNLIIAGIEHQAAHARFLVQTYKQSICYKQGWIMLRKFAQHTEHSLKRKGRRCDEKGVNPR